MWLELLMADKEKGKRDEYALTENFTTMMISSLTENVGITHLYLCCSAQIS